MPARNAPSVSERSARGGCAGSQYDEQRDDSEGLAIAGRGQRFEERAHDEASGEDGDGEGEHCLAENDHHLGAQEIWIAAERGCESQQEDGDDILRHQNGRRRASHRAAGLVAVGKKARDHSRGGEGERDADQHCDGPWKPKRDPDHREGQAAQDYLQRCKSDHVGAAGADLLQREMQADVEQQEYHAEVCKKACGLIVLDEAEAGRPDYEAGDKIADDGAQPCGARGKRRRQPRAEINDGRLQGFNCGHGPPGACIQTAGAATFPWRLPCFRRQGRQATVISVPPGEGGRKLHSTLDREDDAVVIDRGVVNVSAGIAEVEA